MKNTIKVAISGIRIVILLAVAVLAGNAETSFAAIPNTPTLFYPYNNSTVNGTMISFTWNAVDNVTYYWLQVSTNPTVESNYIVNTSANTWTNYAYTSFPDDGTMYYWRICLQW